MDDDIETLLGIITHHVMRGTPAQRESIAALERVATKQGHYHDVLKELREGLLRVEAERDALRAKLERGKEALEPFSCNPDEYEPSWVQHDSFREDQNYIRARTVLAELSADAPAQQTQISDIEFTDEARKSFGQSTMDHFHK